MDDVNDAESATADCSENSHCSHRPEDEFQIEVICDVGTIIGFADGHGEDGVGYQPDNNHVGTYGAVIVLLLLRLADAGFLYFESVA